MAHSIIMPKTGMAMEEGTIIRWLKKVGETISKGEAIAVIETDKVTMDLESDYEGILLSIIRGDGEVVTATHTIAWVGTPGEKVPSAPEGETLHQRPASVVRDPAVGADPARPDGAARAAAGPGALAQEGKTPATPAARAYAARTGIALSSVAGTGPGGAIRLRDFPPADLAGTPARSGPGESIRMTGMRRVIADKMLRSHQLVPPVTLITRADVTELSALRERVNAGGAQSAEYRGALKVSYTDFIVRAVALALREHPLLNSVIEGDRIVIQKEVNIGIAVALEAGLIVPVIKDADALGIRQIAGATRELADRARAGTLAPDQYTGGTFTITNLGMYGITEFTPLVNIPESAILGVGAIEETLRIREGGGIESRKLMSLCLTHDHRHIDGAPAAAFLGRIKALLEDCYCLIV
jgi:pyruvate dehydrogenase E2 component (dihydrolipoamide acetyltransferase)